MTKTSNKRRKKSKQTSLTNTNNLGTQPSKIKAKLDTCETASTTTSSTSKNINPLLNKQSKHLSKLPNKIKHHFFSNQHVDPELRAQIWSEQADLGESLVNQYSWATPDPRALKILKYFSSSKINSNNEDSANRHHHCGVVEIGCGANAYWSRLMHNHGIDVLAFDTQLNLGGKIDSNTRDHTNTNNNDRHSKKKRKKDGDSIDYDKKVFDDGFVIYKGGPEVLSCTNNEIFKDIDKRVLFLCYPDEDVFENPNTNQDEEATAATTMSASCLEHFQGDTIIHAGELVGDTISMDQAPWGRSSGPEFQQRLSAEYHCILKAKLTNWLHVRDTISVWKRSQCCSIVFQDEEDDDDSDEEVEYKYIPQDEILPVNIAAPCAKHLL